jgi:molybdenum cofactor guanylyltransferase
VEQIPVYILAGGRSSRFGADKARALIQSVPLVARIARQLSSIASRTVVVADVAGKYEDLGLRTIADRFPGLGPLAGLHSALCDATGDSWLLLASCDIVAARHSWVAPLFAARQPKTQAVAFRHEYWEPLFALYNTALCDTVARSLERRELAMQRLLSGVGAVAVALPADWPALCHVNTPAELAEYVQNNPDNPEANHG